MRQESNKPAFCVLTKHDFYEPLNVRTQQVKLFPFYWFHVKTSSLWRSIDCSKLKYFFATGFRKPSRPPVSSDRSYNIRLKLIWIIILTTLELLLIVWLGHKHMILSPLFVTECFKDAQLLRAKKKPRNNPVTQQLKQAAETYSVDQTQVIVPRGYMSPWHYGKTLKTSNRG